MHKKFDEEKIVKLYQEGQNTVELAKMYGTYNTSIRRILIRNNVPIRKCGEDQKFVKTNPFSNNNISDYFVGLLIADGCISDNKITLGLKEEDLYMLELYAKFLSDKVKVLKYFHKKHNIYQYQVIFRSTEISDFLKTKAIFTNKSYNCKILVPLNWDILRGLSDGDGCFGIYNGKYLYWDFANGSKEFCIQIQEFLLSHGIKTHLSYNHCYHLRTNKDSYKLGSFLYQNSVIHLKRKYDKWAHCMVTYKKNNTLNSGKPSEGQS